MRENLAAALEWWRAPRAAWSRLFSDELRAHWQGRSWPLGGQHRGRAELERAFAVADRIWPRAPEICKTEAWANRDSVLVHWFARAETWTGQPLRCSGWAVWTFRGGRVVGWRNYLDTSFQAEVTRGWREAIGAALGKGLPNWEAPQRPFYPDPMAHV
jgi:ketosteroid isomerase-like protein